MIAIIAAISKNYVIGNKGVIPWKIKGEQKRFKDLTTGKTIIMGKRSFEEIGKPLPNRKTILVSNTVKYEAVNCKTARSLEEALKIAGQEDVFIAGGEMLYKEALPLADIMYITMVEAEVDGDTFFPRFNEANYIKTIEGKFEGEIPYTYMTYIRK
jgi:dihydrofolate reductase